MTQRHSATAIHHTKGGHYVKMMHSCGIRVVELQQPFLVSAVGRGSGRALTEAIHYRRRGHSMHRPSIVGLLALTIALATVLLWGGGAMAGQFKNLHGSIPDGGCNSAHSSPKNVSSAMAMEVFEFVTPVQDSYRCCILQNSTNQDLFVRLIGLTGSPVQSFQTAVNGTGCTPFNVLGAGFAFQCIVASGAGSPVSLTAHYIVGACR